MPNAIFRLHLTPCPISFDTTHLGGLVVAMALFATNLLFKKILYKQMNICEIAQDHSIILLDEGKLLQENLKVAEITVDEIEAAAREHGVEKISEVKLAILEVDGNISIVSNDFENKSTHPSHRTKHKLKGRVNNL